MFDWLEQAGAATAQAAAEPNAAALVMRLLAAVLMGAVVGGTYFFAQRRSALEAYPFITTLVLLTVLVAMTTLIIGDSVARAFSLVGALSIVRFRTVVEDTRDTAFVIYAVVIGMAMGSGHLAICWLGVPIVSLAAVAMFQGGRLLGNPAAKRLLEVRIGNGHEPEPLLAEAFRRYLHSQRLIAATTAKQGAAIELEYEVQVKPGESPLGLVQMLHRTEGVQQVRIKEP